MVVEDNNPFAEPFVRKTRVRRISMAVSLAVSWLYVLKLGQMFSGKVTEAFISQDRYRLSDAAEEFTLSVLFIVPAAALSTYWVTRLIIAALQFLSRYMASRRNVQTT